MGEIISGLEHKIEIKERTEEYIDKIMKTTKGICKKSATLSKDQPENHRHQRRRVASKRHKNYIQKIIAENLPNLDKEMPSTGSLQDTKQTGPK
jgi:hypothetical protein